MPRVLIVDDEEPLRNSLSYAFGREGYAVSTAEDGPSALSVAREQKPDVILLDVMLPGLDGLEVCRRIRSSSSVPILMLTAKDHVEDKVQGLQIGADDYVTKPFNTKELLARTEAVLRRHTNAQRLLDEDRKLLERVEELAARQRPHPQAPAPSEARKVHRDISLDVAGRQVTIGRVTHALAAEEVLLLERLMESPGRVVTRTELIERMWGNQDGDLSTMLKMHVRRLRDRIEEDPANPRRLLTIPGIGYQLE